jgi:hypothetical protein
MEKQTNALRNLFGPRRPRNIIASILDFDSRARATARRDFDLSSVDGWDEMQGYPDVTSTYGYGDDTVGVNWGQIAHGANLALNPFEQIQYLRGRAGGFGSGGGHPAANPMAARMRPPTLPPNAVQAFTSGPRKLLSYMGLGSLAWSSTDTVTEKLMIAEPQAAFRGRRLVIAQAKTAGAAGILVVISDALTVSGMPQTPAPNQPAPVEMFEAATTYSMLDLQIATSATQISLGISVSALPASGETVTVAAGLYGEWLR